MRDDELRRTLTDANPWWRAAVTGTDPLAWVAGHRLLRDRARHDLGYRPTVLHDVAVGRVSDLLVVLAGPRRVGKSVALIDTVAALCAREAGSASGDPAAVPLSVARRGILLTHGATAARPAPDRDRRSP